MRCAFGFRRHSAIRLFIPQRPTAQRPHCRVPLTHELPLTAIFVCHSLSDCGIQSFARAVLRSLYWWLAHQPPWWVPALRLNGINALASGYTGRGRNHQTDMCDGDRRAYVEATEYKAEVHAGVLGAAERPHVSDRQKGGVRLDSWGRREMSRCVY